MTFSLWEEQKCHSLILISMAKDHYQEIQINIKVDMIKINNKTKEMFKTVRPQ
jgi:hypothetical protein